MHKIHFITPDAEEHFLTIEDFEKVFEIRYLTKISTQGCYFLKEQTKKYMLCSDDSQRARWLGALHRQKVVEGYIAPICIQWINEQIGFGVVASQDLPSAYFIGNYAGRVKRRKTFSNNTNAYCFSYPSAPYAWIKYTIDAQDHGNEIRFLNHSETPNCEAIGVCVDGLLHIIVRTTRPIYKGEELCYDYGEQYWKGYEKNKHIHYWKGTNVS